MFILVTGGSGSGKSAYAEDCILRMQDADRYYIATMQCFDEESRQRIARHRSMRAGKGFITIERQLDLAGLTLPDEKKGRPVNVLLECMSNLSANERFDPAGSGMDAGKVLRSGIDSLLKQCDNLVVVTNEIFSDGLPYDGDTLSYISLLGEINCYMAGKADRCIEVVYGLPQVWKGAGVLPETGKGA